jgi:hypothetical protein
MTHDFDHEKHDLTGAFLHMYDCWSVQQIQNILSQHGLPCVVMTDHMTLDHSLPPDVAGIFLPLFAARQARLWRPDDLFETRCLTDNAFGFIANKKTVIRSLSIRMIEILGLKDFAYTWSGLGRNNDLSLILEEIDQLGDRNPFTDKQKSALLEPIHLPVNWLGNKRNTDQTQESFYIYASNRQSWEQGLNQIFQKSAVALIMESAVPQMEAVFTEKTVYSALGNNFPIWIGGYRHADRWKEFGFDVFDDVVDHSYQHYPTLVERCWYALWNNLDLLKDKERAVGLRKIHWSRLNHNRQKILSGQLYTYSREKIQALPLLCRNHAKHVLDRLSR